MTNFLVKTFLKDNSPESQSGREACGKLAGIVGIVCNVILSLLKLAVGFLTNSVSITADAVNNVADAGSSIITLVGFRISGKPADEDHPYGHARFEYVTGLIISFLIMLIGFELFKSSVQKIFSDETSVFTLATAIILVASIAVKLWLSAFNKKLGRMISSKALEATAADSRNDVISTSAVLAASLISHFTGFELDGYIGAAVAVFILISGIGLIKETVDPLLGQAPSKEMYDSLTEKIMTYDGVLGVHDLMVHSYGPGCYFASAHIEMDAENDVMFCHDVMDTIERDLKKELNIHIVVHLDPTVVNSPEVDELKDIAASVINDIDDSLTFHDFRVVFSETFSNVLFDVVLPPKYKYKDSEFVDMLSRNISEKALEAGKGKIFCVITVDRGYGKLL